MAPDNTNVFRKEYRPLSDDEKAQMAAIKDKAAELFDLYEQVNAGRYSSLAKTHLEDSVMWIVKEITG